jgi:hypothetical protein
MMIPMVTPYRYQNRWLKASRRDVESGVGSADRGSSGDAIFLGLTVPFDGSSREREAVASQAEELARLDSLSRPRRDAHV